MNGHTEEEERDGIGDCLDVTAEIERMISTSGALRVENLIENMEAKVPIETIEAVLNGMVLAKALILVTPCGGPSHKSVYAETRTRIG